MAPQSSDSPTKAATDSSIVLDLECHHCGHDVVTDLVMIVVGRYQEVACREVFACFERVVLRAP